MILADGWCALRSSRDADRRPLQPHLDAAKPMNMSEELASENFQIINLIDAMRGCVTAEMRAIVLSVAKDKIEIAFVLYQDSESTRDEIEEIEVKFSGCEGTKLPVHVKVVVDLDSLVEDLGLTGRVVLLRRE